MKRIQGKLFRDAQILLVALAKQAYAHTWLVANPVLARYIRANLFRDMAADGPVPGRSLLYTARKLAQYYVNNLKKLSSFLRERKCFLKVSRPVALPKDEAILLDCDLFIHSILDSGLLDAPNFFPGVFDEIRAAKRHAIVVPNLYSDFMGQDHGKLAEIFGRADLPVLTVFDVTSHFDIVKLISFTLFYPVILLWFLAWRRCGNATQRRAFRNECIDSLSGTVVQAYLRYLHGRGLTRICKGSLKVLSWCENRAGDKMFYKGLRATGRPLTIIGAQLYVFPDNYLGGYITEADTLYGLAPDTLYYNGPYYLPDPVLVESHVGPSLRYTNIFRYDLHSCLGDEILIALGQDEGAVRTGLSILAKVSWPSDVRVRVRFHPSHGPDKWRDLTPQRFELAVGDLYANFRNASVLIGVETGVMVEAVACGIPVINLDGLGHMGLRDMPELGRGKIWLPAKTAVDVEGQLEAIRLIPASTRIEFAGRYRQEFFCEPVPGRLLEAFGLVDPADAA